MTYNTAAIDFRRAYQLVQDKRNAELSRYLKRLVLHMGFHSDKASLWAFELAWPCVHGEGTRSLPEEMRAFLVGIGIKRSWICEIIDCLRENAGVDAISCVALAVYCGFNKPQ
jgi:hypothetical protein